MNWLQADSQRTLLWVTHDTKDIMPLADQHWQMQAGVLTEPPRDCRRLNILREYDNEKTNLHS